MLYYDDGPLWSLRLEQYPLSQALLGIKASVKMNNVPKSALLNDLILPQEALSANAPIPLRAYERYITKFFIHLIIYCLL